MSGELELRRPVRFQLRRTRGWRMPTGGMSVARPSRYGNPFRVGDPIEVTIGREDTAEVWVVGYGGYYASEVLEGIAELRLTGTIETVELAVRLFRVEWQIRRDLIEQEEPGSDLVADWVEDLERLRGHDLGCYCGLGDPCHADVLLELVNGERWWA